MNSQTIKLLFITLILSFSSLTIYANNESQQNMVEDILNQLYQSAGNFIHLKPKIEVSSNTERVAAFYPRQNLIEIEQKAIKICSSFGRDSLNALAFIIGHELAHACQTALRTSGHETSYLAFDYVENGDKRKEHEADVHGIFNAYIAGFKTVDILPDVIQKIYEEYDLLDKSMSKYPPLYVRKQSASEIREKVKKLISIFEAANFISAIGEYEYAANSYEYVSSAYQGSEIFNNMAVNYALHAINFTTEDVDIFLYPLELDWDTRIKKPKLFEGSKELDIAEQRYRIKLLTDAKKMLEKAIRYDPYDMVPEVNMICVLSLLNMHQEAINYYNKRNLKSRTKYLGNQDLTAIYAELALATAYAKLNTVESLETASAIWNKYMNHANPLVAYQANFNKNILVNGKTKGCRSYSCNLKNSLPKNIDNIILPRINYPNKFNLDEKGKYQLKIHQKKNSTVYNFIKGKLVFNIQRINGFPDTTIELKQNDVALAIALNNGYFHVCPNSNAIFRMDENGKIVEWALYYKQ